MICRIGRIGRMCSVQDFISGRGNWLESGIYLVSDEFLRVFPSPSPLYSSELYIRI